MRVAYAKACVVRTTVGSAAAVSRLFAFIALCLPSISTSANIKRGDSVRNPQVSFRKYLTDKRLQAFKTTQLPKEARDHGLEFSRLTQKWEVLALVFFLSGESRKSVVHALVEATKHPERDLVHVENYSNMARRRFFDLLGEIYYNSTYPLPTCASQ